MKRLSNINFYTRLSNKNLKNMCTYFNSISKRNFRNLYDIFNLPDFFDDEKEIKRMYKLFGSRWHPRRNINMLDYASKRFNELSIAYEILADKERKFEYDKLLNTESNEEKFKDVLKPFNLDKDTEYYDNLFKEILKDDNNTFNDEFFKKIDKEYSDYLEKKKNEQNSDKEKLIHKNEIKPIKIEQKSNMKYNSVKSNIIIRNGKRFEKNETLIIEENGDKKTIIEEISADGTKTTKTELIYHDKDGNLVKNITFDDGKGKTSTEQKMLALNDKKIEDKKL